MHSRRLARGYFELDEHTGVLTSHGGMGLLWYSVREYGDFTAAPTQEDRAGV